MNIQTHKLSLLQFQRLRQLLRELQRPPLQQHWKAVLSPLGLRDSKLATLNLLTIVKWIVIFKHRIGGKLSSLMF